MTNKLLIMIAGPYTSGARTPEQKADNLKAMNKVALKVFERGHTPVIGVNLALPIIQVAGEDRFEEIMMPISLSMAKRCDGVIRIGGVSKGADEEIQCIVNSGGTEFKTVDEIPEFKPKR